MHLRKVIGSEYFRHTSTVFLQGWLWFLWCVQDPLCSFPFPLVQPMKGRQGTTFLEKSQKLGRRRCNKWQKSRFCFLNIWIHYICYWIELLLTMAMTMKRSQQSSIFLLPYLWRQTAVGCIESDQERGLEPCHEELLREPGGAALALAGSRHEDRRTWNVRGEIRFAQDGYKAKPDVRGKKWEISGLEPGKIFQASRANYKKTFLGT